MKVSVYLRPVKKSVSENAPAMSNICFRVREKTVDIKVISELAVYDKYWDNDALAYRRTTVVSAEEQKRIPQQIAAVIAEINRSFDVSKANSDWLRQTIEDALQPAQAYERRHPSMLARIHEYWETHDGVARTRAGILDFERKITRYQAYRREIDGEADFTLFVERLTLEDMNDFRDYLVNEHLLREEHPQFYEQFKMRGNYRRGEISNTTLVNTMNMYCMFLHWCKKMRYMDSDLYKLYGCKSPVYGDPFYLTIEERNTLYDADLSEHPYLALVRDIFVFHCFIGCRVGDLYRLTHDNIKEGFLEYMPQKTKKCAAKIVRVPLHEKAKAILVRYPEKPANEAQNAGNVPKRKGRQPREPKDLSKQLLPFLSLIKYNAGIKELLKLCGIDRMVTLLDTHGLVTVQKPLYEVATSHTARKTFVGNLYKQVPDPNLIASMSGHQDGSRAFARYRSIDDDMKRKLVEMIN